MNEERQNTQNTQNEPKVPKITKPSIIKIARKAGIKNISDECIDPIRQQISKDIRDIINHCVIINDVKGTKTVLLEDLNEALRFMGHNVAKSYELSCSSFSKGKVNPV